MVDHENKEKLEFSARLKMLMENEKKSGREIKTQGDLGKLFNVSQKAAGKWAEGKSIPRYERIINMAKYFKCNPAWLAYGTPPMRSLEEKDQVNLHNADKIESKLRRVWLISWVQAGDWGRYQDVHQPTDGENPVLTTKRVSDRAYALRVKGKSMENPNGIPTYPEGSIIIVDPAIQAKNGSRVIVKLDGSEETTFKQLTIDGNKKYLEPLNPRYPIIEVDEDATICGVVVQTIIDE